MVTKPLNLPHEPLELDEDLGFESPVAPVPEKVELSPPPPDVTPERAGPAWRVYFHISGSGSASVGLDVWRVTVLGRADPLSAFRPDMDFVAYGAMRYGVSRRHALIRPGEQMLYLIDQNSTNGTWVNGQRLLPGRDFPLADGDTIELGALRLTLRIAHSPVKGETPKQTDERPMRGLRLRWFR